MGGAQGLVQAQVQGPGVQRGGAHQHAAELAHGAFLPIRPLAVQQQGHGEIQEGVAQELQALVVAASRGGAGMGAGMGEGLLQEGAVGEAVAQPGLKVGG